MPPKTKYTREEIVLAALALTRESGFAEKIISLMNEDRSDADE